MIKNHRASGLVFSLTLFPSSETHAEFESGALTRTVAYRIITPIHPR